MQFVSLVFINWANPADVTVSKCSLCRKSIQHHYWRHRRCENSTVDFMNGMTACSNFGWPLKPPGHLILLFLALVNPTGVQTLSDMTTQTEPKTLQSFSEEEDGGWVGIRFDFQVLPPPPPPPLNSSSTSARPPPCSINSHSVANYLHALGILRGEQVWVFHAVIPPRQQWEDRMVIQSCALISDGN